MTEDRVVWAGTQHERKVERFYGRGADKFADFHGGYLNFGYWKGGIKEYLFAAENLTYVLSNKLGLNKDSLLLDVGFGHGTQDVFIYNTFGCEIEGIDVTWQHVQNARERINKTGINDELIKVHFTHGTATALQYEDDLFSHLLSIEAPEHFDTRERFLKEAYRVLKPSGRMVLADFALKRYPTTLWEKFIVEVARRLWHVPKANWIDIPGYERQLRDIGFKNIKIDAIGEYTIPGYYEETCKKENLEHTRKIRGWFAAYPGHLIDYAVYKAFKDGLIDYVIVEAEK